LNLLGRGFKEVLVEKYGRDIIVEKTLLEVKDLTINSNNTGKLNVNELRMKFNVGGEWVGTTINHPITIGICKLYSYFPFILF
jgi:hypothetical protein